MRTCIARLRTGRCTVSTADRSEHDERLQRHPSATVRSDAADAAWDWVVRQLRWEADLTLLERKATRRDLNASTSLLLGDATGLTTEFAATRCTVCGHVHP